jgi:hypothetical protein
LLFLCKGQRAHLECGRTWVRIKPKTIQICICCFSRKDAPLRSNQTNASEWSDTSIHRLVLQWAGTTKIQRSGLVYYKADVIIISSRVICSPHDRWKNWPFGVSNNHSLTHLIYMYSTILYAKLSFLLRYTTSLSTLILQNFCKI